MDRRTGKIWITLMMAIGIGSTVAFNYLVWGRSFDGQASIGFGIVTLLNYDFRISTIVVMGIGFLLRFRLVTARSPRKAVSKDLAHRLRESRFRVTEKRDFILVHVSSLAAIKIRMKDTPEGTVVCYNADATPKGWSVIIITFFILGMFPVALAISLWVIYESLVFASEKVLPRVVVGPIPEQAKPDIRGLLIDSLSEGYRLASESYEAAKSNHQDRMIIHTMMGMLSAIVIGVFGHLIGIVPWLAVTIGIMTAAVLFVAYSIPYRKRTKSELDNLLRWSWKLESALYRETTENAPENNEPPSFELIAESCKRIPDWSNILKRSGLFRAPGDWLIIIALGYIGAMMTIPIVFVAMIGELNLDSSKWSVVTFVIGLLSLASSILLYRRVKRQHQEEANDTVETWSMRCRTLKEEMEDFLRDV